MKNINEQINRIKSLFSEERLFGNLVEQENGETKNKLDLILDKKDELGCKRIIEKNVRLFEKNPNYLEKIKKDKELKDSEYKNIEYCNTNYGYQYSGDRNVLRLLNKLGIQPNLELPNKTEVKTKFPIVDDKGKKWGTLKREKTYEYSITGEEGVLIIDRGMINKNQNFTKSLYKDLVSFDKDYSDYSIEDIFDKIVVLKKDEDSKKQYIRFKIEIF